MGDFTGEPTKTKARKQHQCYWCGQRIEKGDNYIKWSFVQDGSWGTTRVHPECNSAWLEGIRSEPSYYGEEVARGDHNRGCLCQRGTPYQCDCNIQPAEVSQ